MPCIRRALLVTPVHRVLVLGSAGLLACQVWGISHVATECLMPRSWREQRQSWNPARGFSASTCLLVLSSAHLPTTPKTPAIAGEIGERPGLSYWYGAPSVSWCC